jgi:hypothetical protein
MRRASSACVLLLLAAVLAAVGLAACGSGGGSSSSTPASAAAATTPATPATTATAAATATTASSPTAAPAKPAPKAPRSSPPSGSAAGGSSGGAASFRTVGGDNSIPEFGQEAPASERQRAAAALAAFLRARAGGEWAQACSYLAGSTRAQLERLLKGAKGGEQGLYADPRGVLGPLRRGPRRPAHRWRGGLTGQGQERLRPLLWSARQQVRDADADRRQHLEDEPERPARLSARDNRLRAVAEP